MTRWLLVLSFVFALAAPVWAVVAVSLPFGDNMVLQRGRPVPVWGTAAPGEAVTVRFAGQTAHAVTGADGRWQTRLRAMHANGTGRTLTIAGTNTLTLNNVLVGEVWLCSGQSNMDMATAGAQHSDVEAADAVHYPQIRLFNVRKNTAALPQTRCGGEWDVCGPVPVKSFSAVGYFFARTLYTRLHVPIGVIESAWGGTPAESWTALDTLKRLPGTAARAQAFDQQVQDYLAHQADFDARRAREEAVYQEKLAAWFKNLDAQDKGFTEHWADPAYDTTGWKTVTPPLGLGNVLNCYSGSLWHRKTVTIPPAWVGKALEVHLGAVDEADDTFVNGEHVGRIWYDVPNFYLIPRVYPVPARLVTSTTVTITVRDVNIVGDTGLMGPAGEMKLLCPGATGVVPLTGPWRYQVGLAIDGRQMPQANYTPVPGGSAGDPTSLYNGMIAPLVPFALRGAIWYQGEANAGDPNGYRALLPGMIACWRTAWGQGDFPFGIVSLANFMGRQQAPVEKGSWADLREAQALTAQADPHNALALAIDIGDAGDIHPKNKQEVGRRLALPMLARVYGQRVPYSGPRYAGLTTAGATLRLRFDFADGLAAHGSRLAGFAVAGADKVFHLAQARIEGRTVVVWSPAVPAPVAARYAWANNPICNLYNAANLPAIPFRTDTWADFSVAGEKVTEP